MEQLEFKLEKFEGPLDLLLHLIDRNKIDIYDIPIAEITDQYMDYVGRMQAARAGTGKSENADAAKGDVEKPKADTAEGAAEKPDADPADMDTMSEFLVMAATLLDIKCRMLLPKEKDEEGNEIDPRDELVQKLLNYKMCKYMSAELRERESLASQNVYREKQLPHEVLAYVPPVNYQELIGDTTLTKLNEIFQAVLKRQKFRVDPVRSRFGRIEAQTVDLDQKELYIKAYLNKNRHTSFRHLLEENAGRDEVIVTFLVVLELIKTGNVRFRQDTPFGDISIETIGHLDATSNTMGNVFSA